MARNRSQDLARQLWLQSMLSNRVVSEKHAQALYRKALSLTARANGEGAAPLVPGDTAPDFDDFVSLTSSLLERVGMDLRSFVDQDEGVRCLAIINARDDVAAKEFGAAYSKPELAYIKRVVRSYLWFQELPKADCEQVKAIMTAPGMRYSMPQSAALRLASQAGADETSVGLTRRAAQDLIYNLQLHGWFALVHNKTRVALGVRALLELRDSLANEFDVRKCAECHELVVSGAACGNTADGKPFPSATDADGANQESEPVPCTFAFQARCSKAALGPHIRAERAQGRLGRDEAGPATCPVCHGEWNPIVVGEDGAEDEDVSHMTQQDEDEEDEDEDGNARVPLGPRAVRRQTTRGNARSFFPQGNDDLGLASADEMSENDWTPEAEENGADEEGAEDEPPRSRRRNRY